MAEPRHITLRELQRAVKRTLDEQFELPVWVSAEIAEIKVNYSGHCYLELVEKGGANGVPTAQARAMIWSSNYPRIAAAFASRSRLPTSTRPTRWATWRGSGSRPSSNCSRRGSGR